TEQQEGHLTEAVGTGNVAGLILPSASVRCPSCCSVVNGSFATQGARGSEGTKDLRGRGGEVGGQTGRASFPGSSLPGGGGGGGTTPAFSWDSNAISS